LHHDAVALLKEQEVAYQGAEELLRQKTILFSDAIKRLEEQKEKMEHLNNITLEYEKETFRLQTLLKEQEKKPLQCNKCSYHREDGWCGMHGRLVKETDYCSLGAWKGR
jgi:hypothetical protein